MAAIQSIRVYEFDNILLIGITELDGSKNASALFPKSQYQALVFLSTLMGIIVGLGCDKLDVDVSKCTADAVVSAIISNRLHIDNAMMSAVLRVFKGATAPL